MPELKVRRRLNGGTGSGVKAASRDSGGATAPALRRASATDTIKTGKSRLTPKTVAHSISSLARRTVSAGVATVLSTRV